MIRIYFLMITVSRARHSLLTISLCYISNIIALFTIQLFSILTLKSGNCRVQMKLVICLTSFLKGNSWIIHIVYPASCPSGSSVPSSFHPGLALAQVVFLLFFFYMALTVHYNVFCYPLILILLFLMVIPLDIFFVLLYESKKEPF